MPGDQQGSEEGRIRSERIRYGLFEIAQLPDGKKIRNRCVQFHQMTSAHTFQLDDFIRAYSTGYILDRRSGEERRKFNDPRYQDPEWAKENERRSGEDRRAYPVIV